MIGGKEPATSSSPDEMVAGVHSALTRCRDCGGSGGEVIDDGWERCSSCCGQRQICSECGQPPRHCGARRDLDAVG
jgi:hypothetical protein